MDRTTNARGTTLSRRTAIMGALATAFVAVWPAVANAAQTTEKPEPGASPVDAATPGADQPVVFPVSPQPSF